MKQLVLREYALLLLLMLTAAGCSTGSAKTLPDPKVDESHQGKEQVVVFAGGCFWGVQAVFEHVKGVSSAVAGYAGGTAKTAEYEIVSSGMTGHAESVKVIYDPSQVTFGQLLKVFFSVAHDPTELNQQGPDEGTQYRSAIFYQTEEQKRIADFYIAQLSAAHVFSGRIVTEVVGGKQFYPAEGYHQHYLATHPNSPYIMINDVPKVRNLQKEFSALYVGKTI